MIFAGLCHGVGYENGSRERTAVLAAMASRLRSAAPSDTVLRWDFAVEQHPPDPYLVAVVALVSRVVRARRRPSLRVVRPFSRVVRVQHHGHSFLHGCSQSVFGRGARSRDCGPHVLRGIDGNSHVAILVLTQFGEQAIEPCNRLRLRGRGRPPSRQGDFDIDGNLFDARPITAFVPRRRPPPANVPIGVRGMPQPTAFASRAEPRHGAPQVGDGSASDRVVTLPQARLDLGDVAANRHHSVG